MMQYREHKRSVLVALVFLPMGVYLFALGWLIYCCTFGKEKKDLVKR